MYTKMHDTSNQVMSEKREAGWEGKERGEITEEWNECSLCLLCMAEKSESFVTKQLVGWEVPEGTQGAGCNSWFLPHFNTNYSYIGVAPRMLLSSADSVSNLTVLTWQNRAVCCLSWLYGPKMHSLRQWATQCMPVLPASCH